MNISRENIGELNEIIRIKLEESDYASKVEQSLKDYRKKANLPGFRPGHVPMGYIVKAYGNAAKADVINNLLSESLFNYLKDNNLRHLGEPMPYKLENEDKIDFQKDKEFEFAFEIGLVPEIEFEVNKNLEVNYYTVEPEEKYISSTIEQNQKRFSEETDFEVIDENIDMIRVNFEQVDSEGNVIENGQKIEDVLLAISMIKAEDLKTVFNGLKVGSTIVFNPMKAFQNETEVSAMLKVEKTDAESMNADYKTTINRIFKYVPAELNEDFYKKLFGQETTIKSESELKEELRNRISNEFTNEASYRFYLDTKEKIKTETNISLPHNFLKRWLKEVSDKKDKPLDDETFEKEYSYFAEDLKWQIIAGHIFQKNNLQVTDHDVHEAAEELVISDLKRYGIPTESIGHELVHQFVHSMLDKKEDRERAERFAEQAVLIEFFKNNITLVEKTIGIDEFNELAKKEEIE